MPEDTPTDPDPERSVAHDLLASPIRRAPLWELRSRQSGQATLQSLATAITHQVPAVEHRSLPVVLHHIHLPKLDAAGVVEYDPDRTTARYSGDCTVERHLELASESSV
jgi:hypothetical protein